MKDRWQFSLRSLLIAVTLIALGLPLLPWSRFSLETWMVVTGLAGAPSVLLGYNANLVARRQEFWNHLNDHSYSVRGVFVHNPAKRPTVPWIRELMGDQGRSVLYDPRSDPDGRQLGDMKKLFPEVRIYGSPPFAPLPDDGWSI